MFKLYQKMIKRTLVKNSYHPTIGQAYKAKAGRFPCAFGLVPLLLFGLWKKKVVTLETPPVVVWSEKSKPPKRPTQKVPIPILKTNITAVDFREIFWCLFHGTSFLEKTTTYHAATSKTVHHNWHITLSDRCITYN